MKIVIIGGVAGGASTAARLRRLNETAEIVMVERGEYISYANCGLPYYIGGVIKDKEHLTLQTPASFHARFNVDVRILSEAISISPESKTLTIKDLKTGTQYQESYDKLVLSPGAEPMCLPIPGADSDRAFTLRSIPDTLRIKEFVDTKKPRSAVVVGGGYIGIEMAENLHSAGMDVTIVELSDHIIAPLDYDMACELHGHIQSKGVHLLLGTSLTSISQGPSGLELELTDRRIDTDMLIMAAGVRPEGQLAKNAGLSVSEKGSILVNSHMQTSHPDIYAVGDAVLVSDFVTGDASFIPLAGPANRQGRITADHICGITSEYEATQGTAILKCFDMTVACTGINEARAKAKGIAYEKSFTYSASHASYYPGAVNMSLKLIWEKESGRILGAQITGYEGVDKRCDVIATAMRAGMSAQELTKLELCYAPPFSSAKDPVNMAGYVAQNIMSGKVKPFHWHDVKGLDSAKSTLLDVRTNQEFENGAMEGFINIPLDNLRDRLGEIDKSKPVYVTCQIGLRGYIACRILTQNGFDCYNLSGGYRLYKTIFGTMGAPSASKMPMVDSETQRPLGNKIEINASGLQCPGPIMKLSEAVKSALDGDIIEITTTDPAFACDVEAWCKRTGNLFGGMQSEKGISKATVIKASQDPAACSTMVKNDAKNLIVFSGDLDKAIASFIIANAAASMGRRVQMFFTFWGLNILRRPKNVKVKKDILSRMFGMMMPRGTEKLTLSKMNMLGMGSMMIRMVMKKKNVASLLELIQSAQDNGVELIACTMSMDVMGIKAEELIDGVKLGGAAAMLANAEESDMSLFI